MPAHLCERLCASGACACIMDIRAYHVSVYMRMLCACDCELYPYVRKKEVYICVCVARVCVFVGMPASEKNDCDFYVCVRKM